MRNDYTDYLMHSHKYDAKKWIKGKWRYFYDEKLGGKEKRQYEKDRTAFENARNDLNVKQRAVIKSKKPEDVNSKENRAYHESASKYLKTNDDLNGGLGSKYFYENTVLGKLDKAKSKAKAKIEKIFEKQIAEADAKKTAKQRKAREESMAAEAKAKTESNEDYKNKRASEYEAKKTAKSLAEDIRKQNQQKRENGYAEEEKKKKEARDNPYSQYSREKLIEMHSDAINEGNVKKAKELMDAIRKASNAEMNKDKERFDKESEAIKDIITNAAKQIKDESSKPLSDRLDVDELYKILDKVKKGKKNRK